MIENERSTRCSTTVRAAVGSSLSVSFIAGRVRHAVANVSALSRLSWAPFEKLLKANLISKSNVHDDLTMLSLGYVQRLSITRGAGKVEAEAVVYSKVAAKVWNTCSVAVVGDSVSSHARSCATRYVA